MIEPDSRDFLIAALDPYHDREFDIPKGYPDACTEKSVVRCFNFTTTIAAPEGVASTWDCIINNSPFLGARSMKITSDAGTSRQNNLIVENIDGAVGYKPGVWARRFLNIDSYIPNGTGVVNYAETEFPSIFGPAATTGFQLSASQLGGIGRIVGCGFEVHNVTPELYRAGTVTIGEVPQSDTTCAFCFMNQDRAPVVVDSAPSSNTFYERVYNVPVTVRPQICRPSSSADLMVIPGSVQWEAAKGAYVVLGLQSATSNEPSPVDYVQPLWWNSEVSETGSDVNESNLGVIPTDPLATGLSGRCSAAPVKWTSLATKCAYFTGLSPETKLTINVRIFYESFPSNREYDILTLATPSAQYDPHAIELYQRCLTHLPVGVPVGMNGLGEWFAMAVSEFADVAGLGLSAMGVPFATQLAGGAKVLADRYIKADAAKKSAQGKSNTVTQIANRKRKKKKRVAPTVK